MKRLLHILLAALALPIAVSANFIYLDYVSNNYQNMHLLISYGWGGRGGSNSTKTKAKAKAKFLYKKRQAKKKAAEDLPLHRGRKKDSWFLNETLTTWTVFTRHKFIKSTYA